MAIVKRSVYQGKLLLPFFYALFKELYVYVFALLPRIPDTERSTLEHLLFGLQQACLGH